MKRFLLWDYPRACWQYDVMVGLILAFVFLTPRELFRDQARASSVVMLPAEHGTNAYWIEPELLADTAEANLVAKAGQVLKDRYGHRLSVVRLEPIFDAEQEIKGYMAYIKR